MIADILRAAARRIPACFSGEVSSRDEQALSLVQDTFALLALQPLIPGFLPLSASALRPAAMLLLVNDIVINNRRTAVEFGAGASTVVLGNALRQTGGQLISVEHDLGWLAVVRALVDASGLASTVTLVHAPLEPLRRRSPLPQSHSWYAETAIDAALQDAQVDFMLVDGPPAYREGSFHQRYPAVPFLQSRLSHRCFIALDDASRAGERDVYAEWSRTGSIAFHLDASTNLAIGVQGQAYHSSM